MTTLSAGQFAIEYTETQGSHVKLYEPVMFAIYCLLNFSLSSQLEGTPLLGRRHLESDVDIPSSDTTNRLPATSGYPPRRKSEQQTNNSAPGMDDNGNRRTIFAIDDESEAV